MAQIVYAEKLDFKNFMSGKMSLGDLLNNLRDSQNVKLLGGLDHYEVTKKQILVFDRGNNSKSRDYIIRSM